MGSSLGSSSGVDGSDDSTVDVELIESLTPRCIAGVFVGDGSSLSPKLPPSAR
jgi:hypothetical protein